MHSTNLMDDTRAWLPEAHAKLSTRGRQEVIDLLVLGLGNGQVSSRTVLSSDQVVAVDRGWRGSARQA